MTRKPTLALTAAALALSLATPVPAQAGILSWLVMGAGAACATSERCADRARTVRADAAARARTRCAESAGCTKLARDAADLRSHAATGARGVFAKLFAPRADARGATVANPFAPAPGQR